MASRKQIEKTYEEVENLKNLLNDELLKVEDIRKELENYKEFLFKDISPEELSVEHKVRLLVKKIDEADNKIDGIYDVYNEFLVGDKDNKSIEVSLNELFKNSENLFNETNSKKKKIEDFYEKVFGVKNENGKMVGGLEKELEKYEIKYNALFEKIESLLPGATSTGLVKAFSDKVGEYKKEEKKWTNWFLWVVIPLASFLGFYYFLKDDINTFYDVMVHISYKLPFLIFSIWLLVFIGNRRAENKKLEESYKHKEVMASSYIGYKKQLEVLDKEDKEMLKKHLVNLLEAMNVNSGEFISSVGDKNPILDILTNFLIKPNKSEKEENNAEKEKLKQKTT